MTTRVVLTTSPQSFPEFESASAVLPIVLRRHPLQEYQVLPDEELRAALVNSSRWRGAIITSPRTSSLLASAMRRGPRPEWSYWTTDAATARPLRSTGLPVNAGNGGDARQNAVEALVLQIIGEAEPGPLLYLAGDPHPGDLVARLADAGVAVDTLLVYRSVMVSDVELMAVLARADLLIVGSPTVAEALAAQLDDAFNPGYIAIGSTTAAACRRAGLPLLAIAEQPDTTGIVDATRLALSRL